MDTVFLHKKEGDPDVSDNNRQISIWLDSYDDIFSDFDPRPFSDRALSDDFIAEVKKVCREDEYEVSELRLLLPQKIRKQEMEGIMVKRLHSYFRKGYYRVSKNIKATRGKGILIALAGMIMLLISSYIARFRADGIWMRFLFVLFEPAGWFFMWTGMDNLFFVPLQRRAENLFFEKMSKTKVVFASY